MEPSDLYRALTAVLEAVPDAQRAQVDSKPDPDDHYGLMTTLLPAVARLQRVYDAEYGPLTSWKTAWRKDLRESVDIRPHEFRDDDDHSSESPYARAAYAYKQASRFD